MWFRRDKTVAYSYVIELKIKDSINKTYEVGVCTSDNLKYYLEDGIRVEKISDVPRVNVSEIFELPTVTEGYNLVEKEKPVSELTWESNLEQSAKYLKYLELSGYTHLLDIQTPSYVEIFLEKGVIRKRVIVFKESIMVGDLMKSYVLPEISKYIGK